MDASENQMLGRELRALWRDEEETHSMESFEYVKRNTILLEYVTSIANEGYRVAVSTVQNRFEGSIYSIGTDYFCIAHENRNTSLTFSLFPLSSFSNVVFEVNNKASFSSPINIISNSFKAKIDELAIDEKLCNIEVIHAHELHGKLEVFKDFLRISNDESFQNKTTTQTYIKPDTKLISTDSIIAISFK